jgi:hypothetical protein
MTRHHARDSFSLAWHTVVARRLAANPGLVQQAAERLARWEASGALHPDYAARWRALLALPVEALCVRLTEPGEGMDALRQVSPFAGVVGPRERWALRKAPREGATP